MEKLKYMQLGPPGITNTNYMHVIDPNRNGWENESTTVTWGGGDYRRRIIPNRRIQKNNSIPFV